MSVTKATKRLTCLFSFLWKVGSDSAEITSSGREFQISEAATGKARLPTVVDVTGGTRISNVISDGACETSHSQDFRCGGAISF